MGSMANSSWSCVPEPICDMSVGHNGIPAVIRERHDSADECMFLWSYDKSMKWSGTAKERKVFRLCNRIVVERKIFLLEWSGVMEVGMKKFDETYQFLKGMYNDGYFPDYLVDKIKAELEKVVAFLETGVSDLEQIQDKFDAMTMAINDLQEEFEENDSEIETAARDSIATDVIEILKWFEIDLDVEDAIGARDW